MDELIGQLAAKAGVNDAVAEKTFGIIPGFLRSKGFSHNVQALIYRMDRLRQVVHELSAHEPFADEPFSRELVRLGRDKIGTDGIIAPAPGLGQIA